MIRNNATVLQLASGANISSVDLEPSTDNNLELGSSNKHWSNVFSKNIGTFANDTLSLKQNNTSAVDIGATDALFNRHLIIQAKVGDNESKLLNVKNTLGSSVAFIDEDGDMTVNNLTVNGAETIIGTVSSQSNLLVEGSLTVSGNVTLGDVSTDEIFVVGRLGSNINLNNYKIVNAPTPSASGEVSNKYYVDNEITNLTQSVMLLNGTQAMSDNMNLGGNKITSLATATASGDAVNKGLLDSEITRIDDKKWDEAGNVLAGTEKFGSTNDQNVTMIRNNATAFQLASGANISSVDLEPSTDNNLELGSSSKHWSSVFSKNIGTFANDTFAVLQNNQNALAVNSTDLTVDRHLVVRSKVTDVEADIFEVRNSSGTKVYSIDEDGDLFSGSITASGNLLPYSDEVFDLGSPNQKWRDLYLSGTSIYLGGVKLSDTEEGGLAIEKVAPPGETAPPVDFNIIGNLSVSGSVSLGNDSGDTIEVLGRLTSNINLNSNKIVNSGAPTSSGDLTNKAYVDNEIENVIAKGVSVSLSASGGIAQGAPVYILTSSDNTIAEADASNIGTSRLIGIANESISDSETGKILVIGFINIPSSRIDGSSFLVGRPVYLSENTGKLTATAPSTAGARIYQVGIATSSTQMVIDIKQGITIS